MSLPAPLTPAERFARIVATLLAMVGARVERPGKPGLAGPLSLAIAIRLERMRNRIARFAARWQAGTLTPPRPRTRQAAPRRRSAAGPWDHLPNLPRGRLWLVKLVPGIGVGANYLRLLLDDPEMAAMIAAAPQIGRTLRPFWHMLSGEPLPPLLHPPRPAAAAPAEPSPDPTPQAAAARTQPAKPAHPRPPRPPRDVPAPAVAAPASGPALRA